MSTLYLDFETASTADLPVVGLDNYLAHPNTRPILAVLREGDGPPRVWSAEAAYILGTWVSLTPAEVRETVQRATRVVMHNAGFDVDVAKRFWGLDIPREKVSCTMARCAVEGLPLAMSKVAIALSLPFQKANASVMRKAATLGPGGALRINAEEFSALVDYCTADVNVTAALDMRLPELSAGETEMYWIDYEINRRGVFLDKALAQATADLLRAEETRLLYAFADATGGVVASPRQTAAFKAWLDANGIHVDSVAKDILDELDLTEAPVRVREAIAIRKSLRRSSTAKLQTMIDTCSADNRIRGMFQFNGAATGRWSGRGVQPHNLPRANVGAWYEAAASAMLLQDAATVEIIGGSIFETASKMLRGMLTAAPGKRLLVGDFAQIEARVLPWLAGQQETLDAFRRGEDLYRLAAGGIYRVAPEEVTKEQRHIGKVAVLALGYQGGWRAFESMAKNYGVRVPENEARQIVLNWRAANPRIVQLWGALEGAATAATKNEGVPQPVGRLVFKFVGTRLLLRLPSGRVLVYRAPKIVEGDFGPKIEYSANDLGTWCRCSLYGGLLAENVTQATAAEILKAAMRRVTAAGMPIILHVHDEIVAEVGVDTDESMDRMFCSLMEEPPAWASDLPIAIDYWTGRRYRK